MKKILFSLALAFSSSLVFGQWTSGPTSATSGQTGTYKWTDDVFFSTYLFKATGGKITSSSYSNYVYTVNILWIGTGPGGAPCGVDFYYSPNGTPNHYSVTVTGCAYTSIPVAPAAPTVSTNTCDNKTI